MPVGGSSPADRVPDLVSDEAGTRRRMWVILTVLLLFGAVKAVVFWGAYAVPNPDFPGFVQVGQALWQGQRPTSFKRGPVVGLAIVGVSKLMGDDVMRAGWLLNAALSVANVLLLFAVARRLLPRAAPFLAILTMANPLVIDAQVNPIAETVMLFFMLSTLALIFRGSRVAYVTAAIATMVRYECAVLILLTFVADGLRARTLRGWARAFGLAAIASVPFLIWMGCTVYYWQPGQGHYVRNYGQGVAFGKFMKFCWQVPFGSLLSWPGLVRQQLVALLPYEKAQAMDLLFTSGAQVQAVVRLTLFLNRALAFAAAAGMVLAAIATIARRHGQALVLWAFLLFYFLVHGLRADTVPRYIVPISWILILLCVFGYVQLWRFARDRWRMSRGIQAVIQVGLLVAAAGWLVGLLRYLMRYPSPRLLLSGQWVLLAGLAAIGAIGVVYMVGASFRGRLGTVASVAVVCLLFASYHAQSMRLVGNNIYYVEFKFLMDWFEAQTQPGEKLASRWASTLHFVVPRRRQDIISTKSLAADSLEEFIANCRRQDVKYVTWSTRGSAATRRGLERIGPILAQPQSTGPLQFLDRIFISSRRWINVFQLQPETGPPSTDPRGELSPAPTRPGAEP